MPKDAKPDKVKIRLQDIPLEEIESQIEQARIEDRKKIGEWVFRADTSTEDILRGMHNLKQGKLPEEA